MELYVINLYRSRTRLQDIVPLFHRQNLATTRVEAFDAMTMSTGAYEDATQAEEEEGSLSKGEVARFLSHRLSWQKVVAGHDKYAAIFEDDAFLSADARHFLSSGKWIPKDTDIVKLDTDKSQTLIGRIKKTHYGHDIVKLKGTTSCTVGYIISKKTAQKLLDASETISMPVDEFLYDFNTGMASELKIYQCDPAIIRQTDAPSTIADKDEKTKLQIGKIIKRELINLICFIPQQFYQIIKSIFTGERRKRIPFV